MRSRYSDTARLLEFGLELGGRMAALLGDALPEDAKVHLRNAQRELMQAMLVTYQHQAMNRRAGFERDRSEAAEPRPRRRTAGTRPPAARPPSRTQRIDVS